MDFSNAFGGNSSDFWSNPNNYILPESLGIKFDPTSFPNSSSYWNPAGNTSSTGNWAFPSPGTTLQSTQQPNVGQQFLTNFLRSGLSSAATSLGGGSMSDLARLAGVPAGMDAMGSAFYQRMQIPIAQATAAIDRYNNLQRADDQARVFGPMSRMESMLDNALARDEGERNLETMYGKKGSRSWAEVMANPGGTSKMRSSFNGVLGRKQIMGDGFKYV